MLKPDIVYFGENVPKDRVERAYALVDTADALLVAGSSLTVMSGLRFVRYAAKARKPVVIVNRGATRGDDLADLRLDAGTSETLTEMAERLPPATFGRYPAL
jgi:NAD-dependent SIR2 family protein deacetylase